MKKVYKTIIAIISKLICGIEFLKTWIAEWAAIIRKLPLYKNVKWTKEQQKEFDDFWQKNYGKKISNRWHRLYEACTGIHRIDYFPESLFTIYLEPKVNDNQYSKVFSNKNLTTLFFNNRIENVRTPNVYVFNSFGLYYDAENHLITKEKAMSLISDIGEAVIKPSVDSSSGENVVMLNMKDGVNLKDGKTAEDLFKCYKTNFIIQERIKQHKQLSNLYSNAVNTLRVTTYIVDDKVGIVPISLRIGSNGGEVDNIHAGGIGVYVQNDGTLAKYAYKLGYGDHFEKVTEHPDTGTVFDGYKLDYVPEIIAAAKSLHELVANLRVISWDFTVDENGNIVVIEANFRGQGVWFPQMISGKNLFGDDTKRILRSMR